MAEFNCCECGTHVVQIVPEMPPEPPLCARCLFLPGWFEDQQLRRMLGDRVPPDDVQ